MAALSLQAPEAASVDPVSGVFGVTAPGVVVIDGSGVEVTSVPVGRTRAGRVGGRVDVINTGGALVDGCGTRFTQADRTSPASRMHVWNFLMDQFYKEMVSRF
jgi:hypothetical protein